MIKFPGTGERWWWCFWLVNCPEVSATHRRTSSRFQAVTRVDSFVGAGKSPRLTIRQSVDALTGRIAGISCRKRRKPVTGWAVLAVDCFDMGCSGVTSDELATILSEQFFIAARWQTLLPVGKSDLFL